MSDSLLVERLRDRGFVIDPTCTEAADAIERLRRERDEALRRCVVAEANAEAREAQLREAFLQQVIARIRYIGGRINMQEDDIEVLTDDLHAALAAKSEKSHD